MGIGTVSWSYDQTAIAVSFAHSHPHHGTSSEYHKAAGPFTTVPMPGNRSSLVWMERPVRAEELRGVALVIGQADYESLNDLGNPLNDARAMDDLLSDLGFDVTRVLDRGGERLKREIEDFVADAKGADVALVYYAGHAVEAAGQNYLVPIDADLATPTSAGESLVSVAALPPRWLRMAPA